MKAVFLPTAYIVILFIVKKIDLFSVNMLAFFLQ